jgi:hypothetical protein
MNDTVESVDGAVHDVDPPLGWIRLPVSDGGVINNPAVRPTSHSRR